MIAARRALQGLLPSDLLHDPALGLLLDDYVADVEGLSLRIDMLLGRTTVSSPTALRWVTVLVSRDLLGERTSEMFLTSNGRATMEEVLWSVSRSQTAI